ncbi:MAG TPA: hypothetical protein VI912_01390 [Candidatus Bilamarchaeaceae archaeon]|nr:hypothetical protein [Candidatus Bilamarchaeaceae archaeon]
MKGQMSLEVLITLGLILSFSIPVLFLLLSVSQVGYETSSLLQADAAAGILSDSINDIYSQGPGAKRLLSLNVPTNTDSVIILENEVIIRLRTSSGYYDAVAPLVANVTQNIISRQGPFVASITVAKDASDNVVVEVEAA